VSNYFSVGLWPDFLVQLHGCLCHFVGAVGASVVYYYDFGVVGVASCASEEACDAFGYGFFLVVGGDNKGNRGVVVVFFFWLSSFPDPCGD